MKRILAASSYVAHGTVGLQATLPGLAGPGLEATTLPTVILSNHPGHVACAGSAVSVADLSSMVSALETNGWLKPLAAVFIGYLPTTDHADWAADLVARLKAENSDLICVLDPILGDDPKGLYVRFDIAAAVRDLLVGHADVLTPNRFELAWLTGQPVDDVASARSAARALNRPLVVATSIPNGAGKIANVALRGTTSVIQSNYVLPAAPHGTGDYFAGCLTRELLAGHDIAEALRVATVDVARVLAVSTGDDQLQFQGPARPHIARA